jgi:hypothetical protein
MEVYEPWLTRTDPSVPDLHPSLAEIFPWVAPQAGEAHLVVSGLVECLTVLVDIYPQVVSWFLSPTPPPLSLSIPFLSPSFSSSSQKYSRCP